MTEVPGRGKTNGHKEMRPVGVASTANAARPSRRFEQAFDVVTGRVWQATWVAEFARIQPIPI